MRRRARYEAPYRVGGLDGGGWGAGLVVPVAGEIKLMPGTSASPAYRRIDVDVETGHVHGLF